MNRGKKPRKEKKRRKVPGVTVVNVITGTTLKGKNARKELDRILGLWQDRRK